jgi:hypothetical protein
MERSNHRVRQKQPCREQARHDEESAEASHGVSFNRMAMSLLLRMLRTQSARNSAGRSRDGPRRYPAWPTNLLRHRFGKDRLAMLRLRVPVGKPQNLEPAGITDDPEIQLTPFPVSGRNFDKAR